MKKSLPSIYFLFFLIATVGLIAICLYSVHEQAEKHQINYLIRGVPYFGFCNLYFHQADSTIISSIMDILDYWGDERFGIEDLKEKFLAESQNKPSTIQMLNFFRENGYQAYRWASMEPGKELKEIKKFVNPEKKIPVIVFQKSSLNLENKIRDFRVVIGVFDDEEKVVVHDHNFGNNYEISYSDFESMFQDDARAILAVWPSFGIEKFLSGSDHQSDYLQRADLFNKLGPLLTTEAAEAVRCFSIGKFKEGHF